MRSWRYALVWCCIGMALGVGASLGTRKLSDAYEHVTDRLERIETYISQLDRMLKSR